MHVSEEYESAAYIIEAFLGEMYLTQKNRLERIKNNSAARLQLFTQNYSKQYGDNKKVVNFNASTISPCFRELHQHMKCIFNLWENPCEFELSQLNPLENV